MTHAARRILHASLPVRVAVVLALMLIPGADLVGHAQGGSRARERLRRVRATAVACEHGDAASCVALVAPQNARDARRAGVALDEAGAAAALERGCLGGHAPACDVLAERAEHDAARTRRRAGEPRDAGVAEDARARWYSLGCDFGSGRACFALGRALERGDGFANAAYLERDRLGPDLTRAARSYEEACALGVRAACGAAVDVFSALDDPCAELRVRVRWCAVAPRDTRCRPGPLLATRCGARSAMPVPTAPDEHPYDAGARDADPPDAGRR